MKRLVVCVALLLLSINFSEAQRIVPNTSFVLNLDYAQFRNDEQSSYLEIYYGFYTRLLTYEKTGEGYQGIVRLNTRIKNNTTGEYIVNDVSPLAVSIKDTSDPSYNASRVAQVGYALPFGEYTLEVTAIDSVDASRRDGMVLPVTLKSFVDEALTSDIQLCTNIKNSENKLDPFFKNSLEVTPNPTLVFGVTSHPMVFNYSEFYNLNPEETYTVKSQVVAQDGKVIKESSKQRKFGIRHAVEAGMTNVTAIQSGRYRLRLVLADAEGNARSQTEKVFYIYNPHIQITQPAAASVKASELAGLTADELADEFRKAQYVATDQEIKTFSQITSEEGRREFVAKFWADVEPGRLGRPSITRLAYLQRISVANQRYSAMGREGWRTDRGRVLVLYADPDEIERVPSSDQSKPYEIWHFYAIENGVDFVFVDRSGFGDYILVHSTKRGELRDDSWQRYLQ